MGRRELGPGEVGATTFRGRHPDTGRWTAEAALRQEKLKPTRWQASCRYREPGTRKLRIITATDVAKARAETRLKVAVADVKASEGLDMGRARERLRESLLRLRGALEEDGLELAPRTRGQYIAVLDRYMVDSSLAELELRDVTTLAVKDELIRVRKAGGESTMRHCRALLGRVFDEALDARAIEMNPVAGVGRLPKERKEAKVYGNGAVRTKNRALTAAEEESLVARLDGEPAHVADLILLCLDLGLRISEAVSLRWQDVDFDGGVLHVRGKLVRVRGQGVLWDPFTKDLRERTLPLRKRARGALERRLAARQKSKWEEYVFQTPRKGRPDADNYNSLVREALDRAGLKDCTLHTVRRTVERDLERAGTTAAEREMFMGHTEQVARKHYADYSEAPLRLGDLLDQNVE